MDDFLKRIRFGVNYVPGRKWWYCWNDFQPDDHARDFDAIAGLGADHIRIMLIWPWFQPNRKWISPAHLDRLEALMELARSRRLDVCVTPLTGWLSGWAFRPTFDRPGDFYTSPEMREPVEIYLRTCAARLNRHSNFLGFDLGNELNCCWRAVRTEEGDAWMEWAFGVCEDASPGRIHVNGVDHQPWFYPETFSAEKLARSQKIVPIHSWIEFTGALKRGGPRDPVCTHLASAMAALVRAYAGDPGKPVWLQEFGASSHWMDREEIPGFLESAVRAALQAGICWITWWCSHEIRPEFEFPSLEYDLGLIDTRNLPKPAGLVFQKLAREFSGKASATLFPGSFLLPPDVVSGDREAAFERTWSWQEELLFRIQ